jgi:hypothetical protein
LQKNGKEDANHLGDVGNVKPEKEPPHPIFLTEQAGKKDQNGGLDQRQDRVVQDLDSIRPY